jgi:Rhodopirellula transposase DDE domain
MFRSKSKLRVGSNERRWLKVLGTLNELQARLYVADKAMDLGRGGVSRLSQLTGMSRTTITKTVQDLESGKKLELPTGGMIRQAGGGRKKVEDADEGILDALTEILMETTAGDPMSALRWTNKSTLAMALELKRRGHEVSDKTVGRCLRKMGYSLQLNSKRRDGEQHRDRDSQFHYINRQVKAFSRTNDPVISVDAKKKELVGAFKNGGRTWRPKGQPHEVEVHDFPSRAEGKAIPYGTYDINENSAVVNVGITHDTAEFAVESIRRWWKLAGQRRYRSATRVLICADSGGSNSSRARAWKLHLQQLADETGLSISVCHYPPGTSKWNKIEHRLFSFISLTWKGQPLLNYETVVNLISATKTQAGLKVKAILDKRHYKTGVPVTKAQMEQLHLSREKTNPQWNYTFSPRPRIGRNKAQ